VMLLLLHVWSSAFVRPPTPTLLQGAMACRHTVCGLGRALRRECFCSATVFVAACHGEVSAGSSQVRRQPHWPPPPADVQCHGHTRSAVQQSQSLNTSRPAHQTPSFCCLCFVIRVPTYRDGGSAEERDACLARLPGSLAFPRAPGAIAFSRLPQSVLHGRPVRGRFFRPLAFERQRPESSPSIFSLDTRRSKGPTPLCSACLHPLTRPVLRAGPSIHRPSHPFQLAGVAQSNQHFIYLQLTLTHVFLPIPIPV